MKVAFPVQEELGPQSRVSGHFGTAPSFVIMDTDDASVDTVQNPDRGHTHGSCEPLRALGGRPVDAIVVGGIGAGALQKLLAAGVEVYRGVEGTVLENLSLIQSGRLPAFSPEHTCAGHGPGGGCGHH